MEMRMRRMLVALLGMLAVAVFAPQLASADTSTGTISGTVTNSAQLWISGVSVQATSVSNGASYSATTAADGTYALGGLPAGSYHVLFRPANDQGQNYIYQYYPDKSNAAAAQAVSVTAGQTVSHVDAALATGATVSGKVTDAATGAPLSSVSAYVYNYGGGRPQYIGTDLATTDSSGSWSLSGLPTGTYEVYFYDSSQSNYATQYYNGVTGQDAPTPLGVAAGSTTSGIDAALSAGGQITGTVTDGMTGAPAQGVFVSALDGAGDQFAYTTTDSAGHYTLSGLSASASYRVEFFPPDGSPLAAEFYSSGASVQAATPVAVTTGQTTANINETLGEGRSISGVVSDGATGYPIGGVGVKLFDDAGHAISINSNLNTEADGSYDFTNLPPGSYKVGFSSEGGLGFQYYNDANTLSAARSVTVSAGHAVTNIDGSLTQGGAIKGRVTDAATGQGLADASLAVLDAEGNFLNFGFTDVNGVFEIPGIAPGSYYVEVYPNSQGVGAADQPEFYGGTPGVSGATLVTITAGKTTTGIDFALAPPAVASSGVSGQSTGTPTTTAPTPPTGQAARVTPGPPTLFGGSVSGLGKGKPVVKFRLAAGAHGAPKLRTFKVKLPGGLAFVTAQLHHGVKVTGGGKVSEKVTGGQLVVTLRSPASGLTVSISSPALKVTHQLAAKAAQKRTGTLRVVVTVTPVNRTGHMLSFTVKNPT